MSDFEELIRILDAYGIEYEAGHYGNDDEEDIWLTIEETDFRFSPKGEAKML